VTAPGLVLHAFAAVAVRACMRRRECVCSAPRRYEGAAVATLAGLAGVRGRRDGPLDLSTLCFPSALALDEDSGFLYILDHALPLGGLPGEERTLLGGGAGGGAVGGGAGGAATVLSTPEGGSGVLAGGGGAGGGDAPITTGTPRKPTDGDENGDKPLPGPPPPLAGRRPPPPANRLPRVGSPAPVVPPGCDTSVVGALGARAVWGRGMLHCLGAKEGGPAGLGAMARGCSVGASPQWHSAPSSYPSSEGVPLIYYP
jgi:hypothetical protein